MNRKYPAWGKNRMPAMQTMMNRIAAKMMFMITPALITANRARTDLLLNARGSFSPSFSGAKSS